MVRWVVCVFATGLACTMSNPLFVVDEDPSTGSSGGSSSTDPATGDPPDPADPAQTTDTTGDGALPGTTAPDESSGDATSTSTSTEPGTGDVTTTTSETTGDTTGDPGPCQDVCGTPGCGTCPDAGMVAYPGFAIGAREVSNGEYQQFLAAEQDPAIQPGDCAWNDDYTPTIWPALDPALPVVNIDWCDARAYCEWAGQRLCGAISGGPASPFDALDPTANQWYRACSNGIFQPYPYGKSYKKFACNGADALLGGLLGVGLMPGCEGPKDGVFDLSGNVWEWVDTCVGDGPGAECMRRGGSFNSDPDALRCDGLSSRPRSITAPSIGVRCCSI